MNCDKTVESTELPLSEETFKNFKNARRFAFDIGGSLVKIAFSTTYERKAASFASNDEIYSFSETDKEVSSLNFIKFETKYIELALNFMEKNFKVSKGFNEGKSIQATGGGAYKYKDLIKQKLGVNIEKEDEMQCLIRGCNFLTRNVPNEVFTIDYETEEYQFKTIDNLFPYLLVNIGSGASILKVDSEDSFQRVGGSTIGGATLWGLGSLLSDANGFDELIELAERGDNRSIDMLVKDIYGGGYDILGLKDDLIASSFGKATRSSLDTHDNSQFKSRREELLSRFKQEDIIKSILLMICYDISQIASLYARLYNVNKIFFGGYFIHGSKITIKFLKHGVSYWSQNQLECLFMRHEGYLGAIGAFLKSIDGIDQQKHSWYENYARSSGFNSKLRRNSDSGAPIDCFELNQEDIQLVACPLLLDSSSYTADLVDLTRDDQARSYWFDCFEKTIHTYEKQCVKSQLIESRVEKRAAEFKFSYLSKLNCLRETPSAFGALTVRSLLDLREHCMSEFNFVDVYSLEKIEENRLGLELLPNRLALISSVFDPCERWLHVFKGLLAGNVYDYGAQAFIQKHDLGMLDEFTKALDCVDDCLWSNLLVKQLTENLINKKYKSIAIFVDNSGFDVVLGVLPLVVELLKSTHTKVILCANSKPAINDITYEELVFVIEKACALNTILNETYKETKRLILMQTGSSSPCLDLSRINVELARCFMENRVDFIILEGMGRALHTNFNAKFKCDCLKVAVVKNAWLANRLGFQKTSSTQTSTSKFPVIFNESLYQIRWIYDNINNIFKI